jgi:hypothetical protein
MGCGGSTDIANREHTVVNGEDEDSVSLKKGYYTGMMQSADRSFVRLDAS